MSGWPMPKPERGETPLGAACLRFLELDRDAMLWGATPDEFSQAPDCDVMSRRFADFLWLLGWSAEAIRLDTYSATDTMCGPEHWVTEVDGLWVDWTARQFHNVEGQPLSFSEIACPTIFIADSPHHPVPTIILSRHQEDS